MSIIDIGGSKHGCNSMIEEHVWNLTDVWISTDCKCKGDWDQVRE